MRVKWYMNCAILIALMAFRPILPSLSAAAPNAKGLIKIDYAEAKEEAKVEINLRGSMIKLLANGIRKRNPEGSEFLMDLTAANVRVYEEAALGGRTFDEIGEFYRNQMKGNEWQTLTRSKENGISLGIYSLADGDVVSGLVVLVSSDLKREFAVVNLVGEIDISKLSQLDKITGANVALPEFNFEGSKLPQEKQEKRKEQRQKATENLLKGNHYQAIGILEKLETEGIGDKVDYAVMAVLYHAMGAVDKSYYYLGRLYEMQNEEDIATAFYKKAVEINPESEALEKLKDQ